MSDIEQRVKKIVAEQLGVAEADIKIDSSFVDENLEQGKRRAQPWNTPTCVSRFAGIT